MSDKLRDQFPTTEVVPTVDHLPDKPEYELPHDGVLSLDKSRYDGPTSARERCRQLAQIRNVKFVGEPFETATHYCWRYKHA